MSEVRGRRTEGRGDPPKKRMRSKVKIVNCVRLFQGIFYLLNTSNLQNGFYLCSVMLKIIFETLLFNIFLRITLTALALCPSNQYRSSEHLSYFIHIPMKLCKCVFITRSHPFILVV